VLLKAKDLENVRVQQLIQGLAQYLTLPIKQGNTARRYNGTT
jgi:hypothetical protein